MTVTVFTKPHCPQCDATKRQLTKLGVPFETVDLTQNPSTLEQLQAAGFQQAPVAHHAGQLLDRLPPRPDSRSRPAGGRRQPRRRHGVRVSLSQPEFAAEGKTIGALVYFSSASENTARFVAGCRLQDEGINVYRIPLRAADPALNVREPYVIMVPTYGGGVVKKAVPIQVKRFLNDPANREWIRGVIASGNTNFGEAYCAAGDIIAAKCKVPYLYRYELMGTPEDTAAVRNGLVRFFTEQ